VRSYAICVLTALKQSDLIIMSELFLRSQHPSRSTRTSLENTESFVKSTSSRSKGVTTLNLSSMYFMYPIPTFQCHY
jgi:hypothetical protein